jgi:hypothetical protein
MLMSSHVSYAGRVLPSTIGAAGKPAFLCRAPQLVHSAGRGGLFVAKAGRCAQSPQQRQAGSGGQQDDQGGGAGGGADAGPVEPDRGLGGGIPLGVAALAVLLALGPVPPAGAAPPRTAPAPGSPPTAVTLVTGDQEGLTALMVLLAACVGQPYTLRPMEAVRRSAGQGQEPQRLR